MLPISLILYVYESFNMLIELGHGILARSMWNCEIEEIFAIPLLLCPVWQPQFGLVCITEEGKPSRVMLTKCWGIDWETSQLNGKITSMYCWIHFISYQTSKLGRWCTQFWLRIDDISIIALEWKQEFKWVSSDLSIFNFQPATLCYAW